MADLGSTKVFGDLHVTGEINGEVAGNAASATKLETARTIALSGDVTGSASFDGTGNVTLATTVQDDSHNHTIGNVDGLQTVLDGKAPSTHSHTLSEISDAGTAASKNAPVTGNAGAAEVVMGNDSRLSDARNPTAHSHDDLYYTEAETNALLSGKVDNSRVLTDVPTGAVFTDTVYDDTAILSTISGLQTDVAGKASEVHSHTLSAVTDAGTAASKNVAQTGDASATEVVLGNDSRLSNARTPTAHNHDNLYYTKAEVDSQLSALDALPNQTGQNGKALLTDGTEAYWGDAVDQWTLSADSVALTYNANGDTETATEVIGGDTKVTTISYTAEGAVSSVVITFRGIERTETLTYDTEGRVESITVTEVAV